MAAHPLAPRKPPFGVNPAIPAALLQATLDRSLQPPGPQPNDVVPKATRALRAYLGMGSDDSWGVKLAPAVGRALAGAVDAGARVRMCHALGTCGRAGKLCQALAVYSLGALVGTTVRPLAVRPATLLANLLSWALSLQSL